MMRNSRGRVSGEVIAALLVVAIFCAVVGPVWWRRWKDGTLTDHQRPTASASSRPGRATVPARTPSPQRTPSIAPASVGGTRTAAPTATASGPSGTVLRTSDGDTLTMRIGGRATTVRILNIDTPETHKPGQPVECLGPEAAQALARMLPAGTTAQLAYDGKHTDRYGRTLAALTVDGKLVGAEMARLGFTGAVVVNRADAHVAPVAVAQAEAIAARRGLYDPRIECTLAGQVASVAKALTVEAATTPAQREARKARLLPVVARAEELRASLARPDSRQTSVQRQRYPATWRLGQVQQLDASLARARAAIG